jgi:hypothetical protein
MSVGEIYYRIQQLIKGHFQEKTVKSIDFTSGEIVSTRIFPEFKMPKFSSYLYSLNLFGIDFNYSKPKEINWHEDIKLGEVFKLCFNRKINIRENPNLSAKLVWEINRLQFLPAICMNFIAKKSRSELDLFMQINKSWSDQNPYLMGINWYSNIEINLRLITWVICWEILDADKLLFEDIIFKEFIYNDWLPLIKKHCIYSYNNPSKYSSANNHLISEYAGLFIASSKWEFKESKKWIRYAHNGLENEITKQHSKEGVNKEEAAEYIQFITDFFLLAYVVGEKTANPFSDQYKQQLYKILCYIYDFLDCNGNFPKYGDEDDGKCFGLDYDEEFNNFKSLLTSGAIIFKDPILKSRSNGFDVKNHFLFGEPGKKVYESIPEINYFGSSKYYEDEGHFIFRKNENGNEIYLHFDAAPLGFLSIAAHGHADALSFTLNVDGQPIFVDPGTYTYHTEPAWRSYFIGTLAHNTIRINQHDQAVNGGPTLWTKHYKSSVIDLDLNDDNNRVKATHNGYVKDGAQHIREILFDRLKNEFQILDTIVVKKNRKTIVEIPFHTHPDVSITQQSANCYLISKDSVRKTELFVDEKLNPVVIKGQMEPQILGWYSSSFAKKDATNVIYCKTQIECTTIFKFIIKIV